MPRTKRPEPTPHRGKWRIRWINEHGRRKSESFDDYEDAKFALDRHLVHVQEAKRGLRALSVPDKHFNALCDHWLATRAKRKRSEKDDQSIIRCHLRPFFGRHRLRQIHRGLVDEFIDSREVGEKTINNHLTLLIAMLNEARERGWLREPPRIKKFKIDPFAQPYRWLRNRDESARFLASAKAERNPQVFDLYATALYSGLRAGELAGLSWGDIDFERRLITVQHSYDGPTKGGSIRHVPLMDPLLPILKTARLRTPGLLVFPNSRGVMRRESDRIFQEVLHRVLNRANFPEEEVNGRMRRYIVFHSLRHSFASHWVLGGGDIFKLQKILGHKSISMTQRYAHLAPGAFADDYGRLGDSIPSGEVAELQSIAAR